MKNPIICPAILAASTDDYQRQIERTLHSATRLHIDLTDGTLTPESTIRIDEVWWPGGMRADLHVMYKEPFAHTEMLLDLEPKLIIVHAEAEGHFVEFAKKVHARGIKVGVALQAKTPVDVIKPSLNIIDHVLVFSGNLGSFGGQADLSLLDKVTQLRQLKAELEIGWDGGVDNQNAGILTQRGVDVLNSGGFIQKSEDPKHAFHQLYKAVREANHRG